MHALTERIGDKCGFIEVFGQPQPEVKAALGLAHVGIGNVLAHERKREWLAPSDAIDAVAVQDLKRLISMAVEILV